MAAVTVILLVAVVACSLLPNHVLVSCGDFDGMSFPADKIGGIPDSDFSFLGFFDNGRDFDLDEMKKSGIDESYIKSVASDVNVLGLPKGSDKPSEDKKEKEKKKSDGEY